jgi:DNA-binding CsgD family transcriptional regulator/PAS domain-containing protein
MLMFMTTPISHDGAPESTTSDSSHWAPGTTARSPDAVNALVGSSDVPLAAVDLPSGRFLAVNPAMAGALGSTVGTLTGSSSLDWLSPEDRHGAQLGFQALADGDLTGYQAIRRLANPKDPDQVFSVWVSTMEVDGARVGLASAIPSVPQDNQFRALPPASNVPEPGNLALGTVDGNWRIDRISQDVTPMLGLTAEQCTGQPVLGIIHPSDMPAFLAAVEHARRGERAVRLTLRLDARSRQWTEVTVVLATIALGDPPPLAFALIRYDAVADSPGPEDSTREMRLEAHMLRIADELHAAGLIPRLQQLPALTDEPRLSKLTSREWAILTRLLDGQRVSAIAADLYVSQSTVRNHLSSIYARLGVHSQVDLIRLIRRGTKPPAAGR